jgi:hypothetical protein
MALISAFSSLISSALAGAAISEAIAVAIVPTTTYRDNVLKVSGAYFLGMLPPDSHCSRICLDSFMSPLHE